MEVMKYLRKWWNGEVVALRKQIGQVSSLNKKLMEENKNLLTLVRALRDVNADLDRRLLK
jgi:hypothetical protein